MNSSKVNKNFVNLKINSTEIYCLPEVFALGCFYHPTLPQLYNLTKYLKATLGNKFSDYGMEKEIVLMCYQWFIPSLTYEKGKIVGVTNRFWKNKTVGTLSHKLPTVRNKDLQLGLGLSRPTATKRINAVMSTKLIKSYVDEAKSVNPLYTKIRYVQLNVPLILSILYSEQDLCECLQVLSGKIDKSRFLKDVFFIIKSAQNLKG